MDEERILPLELPAVARKKVSVGFDGGMLSSDAGVLLLRGIERRLGLSERLAACMRDRRDQTRIDHTLEEMLRLRMFAIAAGYEDANDCATLRHDPVFKMAVGRLRFHDLRHTHATLLLQAGVPVAAVSARLGHANAAVNRRNLS
jgi:integrase